jgi:EmrB/QacA subfamily drug resistance transporter
MTLMERALQVWPARAVSLGATRRLQYKHLVAVVFVIGLFMDLLDTTITNVALPTLAKDFAASTTSIEWVVTGYLLSLAVFIPVSGWVGDRFGTKRTFMFALSVFVVASFLCGLAWNIESLITFRVLQGVGGGMLTPVGTAMLFRAFPPSERAQAAAVLTIPAGLAPATGPVLGGYLVQFQSWHWIFLVNVPIGIAGLLLAGLFLREEKQAGTGRFDVPGFLLGAAGLASVMYALAEAGPHGFGNQRVLLFGTVGLTLTAIFAIVELRTKLPMIDVRLLLRDKLFKAANAVQFMGMSSYLGALFLLPLFLQEELGMSPLQSGLTTFPQAIGVAMMAQLAGRLYPRIGPRRMMMAGMVGVGLTSLAFLLVDLQTSQAWIQLILLARGWSFALALVPLQAATFATIRSADTGRASAVFNANRQVAASLGVALLGTVLTSRLTHFGATLGNPSTSHGTLLAFHDGFVAAAALAVVGIFLSLFLDDKEAARAMQERDGGRTLR